MNINIKKSVMLGAFLLVAFFIPTVFEKDSRILVGEVDLQYHTAFAFEGGSDGGNGGDGPGDGADGGPDADGFGNGSNGGNGGDQSPAADCCGGGFGNGSNGGNGEPSSDGFGNGSNGGNGEPDPDPAPDAGDIADPDAPEGNVVDNNNDDGDDDGNDDDNNDDNNDDDDNGGNDDNDDGNDDEDDNGGGGGGGPALLRCLRFEVINTLPNGDVTLEWETRRAQELRIEPGVFETDDTDVMREGRITIEPTEDRYTLVIERFGNEEECVVELDTTDVVVLSERDQQPLVLSLTDIPETGFEAGPFLTFLFYAFLAGLSFVIAYILVMRRDLVLETIMRQKETDRHEGYTEEDMNNDSYENEYEEYALASAPTNLPTGEMDTELSFEEENTLHPLEAEAHTRNALLSSDAVRMIEDRAETLPEQVSMLHEIIDRAKESFPREHGWIVVNRERINAVYQDDGVVRTPEVEEVPAPMPSAPMHEEATYTHRESHENTLLGSILSGNLKEAYRSASHEPTLAIADAVESLDTIYRYRKGFTQSANQELVSVSAGLTDEQIESLIDILTSAIDGAYQNEQSAAKIAILRAVKAVS